MFEFQARKNPHESSQPFPRGVSKRRGHLDCESAILNPQGCRCQPHLPPTISLTGFSRQTFTAWTSCNCSRLHAYLPDYSSQNPEPTTVHVVTSPSEGNVFLRRTIFMDIRPCYPGSALHFRLNDLVQGNRIQLFIHCLARLGPCAADETFL